MKLFHLMEMPVSDIRTSEYGSGPDTTFPEKDWRMATRPAWRHSVQRVFRNSPYTMILHLYNFSYADKDHRPESDESLSVLSMEELFIDGGDNHGIHDRLDVPERLAGIIDHRDIPEPTPGAITVVLFHHFGADYNRLTPWMVAHRMAHALTLHHVPGKLIELLKKYTDYTDIGRYDVEPWGKILQIFQMKAARDNKFIQVYDFDELAYEIVAEFIVTGDIRVKPVEGFADATRVAFLRKHLIAYIKPIIDSAVGKIWVAN